MHPGKDYKKLIERVGHAVKSVNPPAWGVSDIPPATWEGWGVKLFLPKDGPRSKFIISMYMFNINFIIVHARAAYG